MIGSWLSKGKADLTFYLSFEFCLYGKLITILLANKCEALKVVLWNDKMLTYNN